jgi:hypothetical protein
MEAHATTYSPLLSKPRGNILPLIQHLFVEYGVKRQNYKVKENERRTINTLLRAFVGKRV